MASKLNRYFSSKWDGLALFFIGLALLVVHFLAHSTSNILLIVAIVLEISGLILHYRKIAH
ncbi:MAG: hypothetical protein LUI08_02905 [Prevotella sp.]|nr:hypothetical protein [Prevotella sp.]